jgi:hypothetical protein
VIVAAPSKDEQAKDDAAKAAADQDARIAALEADNTALQQRLAAAEEAARPKGNRLSWVVIYPAISLQRKDDDGQPVGDPVILNRGDTLPPDLEDQGPFLRSIGHVTALQVPA